MTFAFLKRNLHWFFAAAAIAVIMTRLIPAFYLHALNSDNIQIPLLFQDVFVIGNRLHDWNWGGHSDLFPDVMLVFSVMGITGDGLLAILVASSLLFAASLVPILILYRQNGGRNTGSFLALVLLFYVCLLNNFGIRGGMHFTEAFTLCTHTGTQIMALVCFVLLQRIGLGGLGHCRWVLFVFCFLTTASDIMFPVIFTIPALITLSVARLLYPRRIRSFIPLVQNILCSTILGVLLAKHIFPVDIVPGTYTRFTLSGALFSLSRLYQACAPSVGGHFFVFLGLNFAVVLVAAWLLVRACRNSATKRVPASILMLWLFCALLILCNWGAVILTGDYQGIDTSRYVRLVILAPPFLLLGCLHALVNRSGKITRIAGSVISLAVIGCAFFWLPSPGSYWNESRELVPVLRSTMQSEEIEAGLADYWYANSMTFLSRGDIKLRAITGDGSLYHRDNNIKWFTGEKSSSEPPGFRLIFMANLDAEKIRQRYGEPSRVIHTSLNKDIWVYPPEQKITFNRFFGELFNRRNLTDSDQYQAAASSLPSKTGKPDGSAIVAEAGRDREDFLTYGPYLHLAPGLYRVKINYSYITDPDPAKLPSCDFVLWKSSRTNILEQAEIPFVDTSPREFIRDVRIPDDSRNGAFEARTYYRGSGSIRIESINISCLNLNKNEDHP